MAREKERRTITTTTPAAEVEGGRLDRRPPRDFYSSFPMMRMSSPTTPTATRDQEHLSASIRQLREELDSFAIDERSISNRMPSSFSSSSSSSALVHQLSKMAEVEVRLVLLLCQSSPHRLEDWEEARDRAEGLWERLQSSSSSSVLGAALPAPSRVGMQLKLASALRRASLQRGDREAGELWTRRFQRRSNWINNLEEMSEVESVEEEGEEDEVGEEERGVVRERQPQPQTPTPTLRSSPYRNPCGNGMRNEGRDESGGIGQPNHPAMSGGGEGRWGGLRGDAEREGETGEGGGQQPRSNHLACSFSPSDERPFSSYSAAGAAAAAASTCNVPPFSRSTPRQESSPYPKHWSGGDGVAGLRGSADGFSSFTYRRKENKKKSPKPFAPRLPTAMQSFKKSLWLEHPQLRWGKLKGRGAPGPRYTG